MACGLPPKEQLLVWMGQREGDAVGGLMLVPEIEIAARGRSDVLRLRFGAPSRLGGLGMSGWRTQYVGPELSRGAVQAELPIRPALKSGWDAYVLYCTCLTCR